MDITQNNDSSIKNGYDNFEKDEFSGNVWSTPVLISPEELKNRLRGCRLEGRTIADIKLVGYCYSLSYYVLESKVVIESDEYDDNYDSVGMEIDYDEPLTMLAEIDEPILIRFEDGDVLELLEECDGEHRVSMNSIPWSIKAGINRSNVDAAVLFNDCIGRTITAVEFYTEKYDEKDNIWKAVNTAEYEGEEYVTDIVLRLDDGNALKIYGWIDFCHVLYVDHNNRPITKPFKEIAPSFYNLEELIADLTTIEED